MFLVVFRYPLLLSRVHKLTPVNHGDKSALKEAQTKIEDIIEHINSVSRHLIFLSICVGYSVRVERLGELGPLL